MDSDTGALSDDPDDRDDRDDRDGKDVPDLSALTSGRWSSWYGLAPLPTVTTVIEQLGPSIDERSHGAMLGGSPTQFRRFRFDSSGRLATVWLEGDLAVAVQLEEVGQSGLDAALGAPDITIESAFGGDWEQRIYGRRGLVVHTRSSATDLAAAGLVFGLPPFRSEDFGDDPIRFEGGRFRRPS